MTTTETLVQGLQQLHAALDRFGTDPVEMISTINEVRNIAAQYVLWAASEENNDKASQALARVLAA